ncbi:Spermidine/putrescine import permease protein PotC [Mycoplasma suis str. Illinois]|uniref:Spermidine/putrescine import permease protein PotC n=1 Tax=Mycoplasma suis (strain Illinois) TaxID=768700 RepID=F0QQ53_MYCSL|nr:Spermidine/putrescine import permease protein PotC [Mycoplasma suis str. Illinois]
MQYFLNFKLLDSAKWLTLSKRTVIFLFFAAIYFPWLTIVFLSFKETNEKGIISTDLSDVTQKWTFQNYFDLFSLQPGKNDSFWRSLWNSLTIAFASVCPALWISIISSFAIWKKGGRLKPLVFKISNLSISSPEIIQGLSFMLLFSAVLLPLGFNFGFPTIILSHIAFLVPYGIILIYPKLEKLNKKLLLASFDLNCGEIETLLKVIIPQLKGSIILSFLVLTLLSMDDFIITNLVKGRIITLTTQMYTMKKGVKVWALTFGSLLLLGSMFFFFVIKPCFKFRRKRNKSNISLLNFL